MSHALVTAIEAFAKSEHLEGRPFALIFAHSSPPQSACLFQPVIIACTCFSFSAPFTIRLPARGGAPRRYHAERKHRRPSATIPILARLLIRAE